MTRHRATILLNGIPIGNADVTFDEPEEDPTIEPLATSGSFDMLVTDPAIIADLAEAMPLMLVCTECGDGVPVDEDTAAEYADANLVCETCYHAERKPQSCATCGKRLECGPAEWSFCGECWDKRGEA